MKTRVINRERPILLGKAGEDQATMIRFPINVFFPFLNGATFSLVHQRAGDVAPYPCAITVADGFIDWVIQSGDVANPGSGVAQLTATNAAGSVAKTVIFTTVTTDSLGYVTPPNPQAAWIDEVIRAGQASSDNALQSSVYATQAQNAAQLIENLQVAAQSTNDGDPPFVRKDLLPSGLGYLFTFGIPTTTPSIFYSTEISQLLMHILDDVSMTDANAALYREPLRDLITPHGYITDVEFSVSDLIPLSALSDLNLVKQYTSGWATYEDTTTGDITDYHVIYAGYSSPYVNVTFTYMGETYYVAVAVDAENVND